MSKLLINQYYTEVDKIIQFGGSRKETSVRNAFSRLLNQYCEPKNFLLIPELDFETKFGTIVYPDGTVKDALRLDWGYWESKGQEHNLDAKIHEKLAQGYPNDNILFENAQTAVLIQRGQEVMRVPMREADKLDRLLKQFINYERPEVRDFRKAIEKFKEDLPTIVQTLREMIETQAQTNRKFQQARDKLLDICQKSINPYLTVLDIREMIIQHILTEEIFLTVFNESQFHRENNIAHELQAVVDTFFTGNIRRNTLASIESYYAAIRREATRIHNHHEKQKFLKVVYENFYKIYNPKAADRLGVVYTPNEIVHFMIESADYLVYKHFGRLLADPNVEILDPATGTGTFITELIEYLPKDKLKYKYKNEIHCNEVNILSYYIANLNIEYTYKQKMDEYEEFENICFVDTLDNMSFGYKGQQQDLFGFGEENTERIKRQNERKISVIIGNPPYNANQKNESENNKNREYSEIDKRIKATYIKQSTAQKTKVYDMYARFFRWASDRLDENGVICFITNNSFIETRTFDGFRKCIEDEFDYAYIINLGGNIRKLSGKDGIFLNERHTIFGVAAAVGIAIMFLVKRQSENKLSCQIGYIHPCDIRATRDEKIMYLQEHRLQDIPFEHVAPDKDYNWINLTDNDFDDLLSLADKKTKLTKNEKEANSVFKLFSLGVVTARDEWVYDFHESVLITKVKHFMSCYNTEIERWNETDGDIETRDFVNREIKWTSELEDHLKKNHRLEYSEKNIINAQYRPFVTKLLYFDRILTHRLYQMPSIFPNSESQNLVICFSDPGSEKPFMSLISNNIPDLHLSSPGCGTQCLPLYRYDEHGKRIDNITDWGLQQFQEHYQTDLTKLNIFHYTYAVLHNPAYRTKYEINLKREFPRLPFYEDFWQWVEWGKQLMELHLNYEMVEPYPLERRDQHVVQQTMPGTPESARPVTTPKPKLKADKLKHAIILDTETSLHGVPPIAWEYKLGNRSALEWILDQYKEKKPRDPTIREKFNTYRFADYKEHVIDLLKRVCTVSVKTKEVIQEMERLQGG